MTAEHGEEPVRSASSDRGEASRSFSSRADVLKVTERAGGKGGRCGGGMADPLRMTLLAKLRGKKSKKGATLGGSGGGGGGGGFGSAAASEAAETNGCRGGKEKASQTQRDPEQTLRAVLLAGMDLTAERTSTYENCVEAESASAMPRLGDAPNASGGEEERGPRGSGRAEGSPRVRIKRFVSVSGQRGVGDSIGFGDGSCRASNRAQLETQPGALTPSVSWVGMGAEFRGRGLSHMAGTVGAGQENKVKWTFDRVCPNCTAVRTEGSSVIRNVDSYDPTRETSGSPHSPAFFPTELQICDLKRTSLCTTQGSRRYPLDSEDDDYYDNEILPFYETARPTTEVERVQTGESGQDKGQVVDGNSAQETDRLRNQLQEAYYLLINAMNDISFDFQQIRDDLAEQQATSSCSSHSRDSLCSRSSVKNIDSDSWSSGGNQSSQHGSDTESLLLCLAGNLESKSRLTSKSMSNLSLTKRPTLLRSASDGGIRYQSDISALVQTEARDDRGASETKNGEVTKADGPSKPYVLGSVSSDEMLHDAGGEDERAGRLDESSGSVNSLAGSSDSNAEAATRRGRETKQEQTDVQAQAVGSANKAHGVTVNKMQEWMHKGRLLSSEMKQRIEGSSLPRGGGQTQDRASLQANLRPGAQTSVCGGKSIKTKPSTIKAPREQQPGRKATRRGLTSRASSEPDASHPSSSRLIIVILFHL